MFKIRAQFIFKMMFFTSESSVSYLQKGRPQTNSAFSFSLVFNWDVDLCFSKVNTQIDTI